MSTIDMVSELVDFRWDQIDFASATLHVRRAKWGTPSAHPIRDDELRALRRLQREQEPKSPFVLTSERGSPFTTAGFARMVERAGVEAKLGIKAHPHMLRHACGFTLANQQTDRDLCEGLRDGRTRRTCGAPEKGEGKAMNIEARIEKLERVLAPSQDHRWHRVIGHSPAECEAAMEAMIASGQATRSDRFVHHVIVTPACMEEAPASRGPI
jgi:hypothetical protein